MFKPGDRIRFKGPKSSQSIIKRTVIAVGNTHVFYRIEDGNKDECIAKIFEFELVPREFMPGDPVLYKGYKYYLKRKEGSGWTLEGLYHNEAYPLFWAEETCLELANDK